MRFHRSAFLAIVVTLALTALLAKSPWSETGETPEELRRNAIVAIQQGRLSDALSHADELVSRNAAMPIDLLSAAEVAWRAGFADRATAYLERIPVAPAEASLGVSVSAAALLLRLGDAHQAEFRYRSILEQHPDSLDAQRGLADILASQGQFQEARGWFFRCLRAGDYSPAVLLGLVNTDRAIASTELLLTWRRRAPDYPGPLIGLARIARQDGDHARARGWLSQVRAKDGVASEARALLGQLLAEQDDAAAFERWRQSLMPADESQPLVWMARGIRAEHDGDAPAAIRCLLEAARLDPDSRIAHFRLAHLLETLGRSADAGAFRLRAVRLGELERAVEMIAADHEVPANSRKAARLTEELGRRWEARGWQRAILERAPNDLAAREALARLQCGDWSPASPRVSPCAAPALGLDPATFPLPQGLLSPARDTAAFVDANRQRVSFVDRAAELGVDFTYFNGDDPTTTGRRILETTGGGVGVIDYDADGWPDLLFTQGGDWPLRDGGRNASDRLFRNLSGGVARDVTDLCGLRDQAFGQGVAAGDIDNDGFADLYIANLGSNRLLRNNGDGTFSDMPVGAIPQAEQWTTSCAIADLNADSVPDLFEVNYVRGDLEGYCAIGGEMRACPPDVFDSESDRLLLGRGDAQFVDESLSVGIGQSAGAGLGLVVADFDGTGRLGVFIANDEQPNFLWTPESDSPDDALAFVDRALTAGVAYNEKGQAQASMGVAAGDADGDGLLDLAVTNFLHQGATLYRRRPQRLLFDDHSEQSGLRNPTFHQLGFGAQFLDADLDGWPDLFVANGHVDDFQFLGRPFRMRSQFLRNLSGQFVEEAGKTLGPYFDELLLGRGAARLDWNGDGRPDVTVSHILDPAALLINSTAATGHYLAVEVRGIGSARDAVGTTVAVTAGGRTWVQQITSGDGYQASNQRLLIFGLGDAAVCDELNVTWPSGIRQTYLNFPVDRRVFLLEGADEVVTFSLASAPADG